MVVSVVRVNFTHFSERVLAMAHRFQKDEEAGRHRALSTAAVGLRTLRCRCSKKSSMLAEKLPFMRASNGAPDSARAE